MPKETQFQLISGFKVSPEGYFVINPKKRACEKCTRKDFLTQVIVIQDDFPNWKYHPLDGMNVCKSCLVL